MFARYLTLGMCVVIFGGGIKMFFDGRKIDRLKTNNAEILVDYRQKASENLALKDLHNLSNKNTLKEIDRAYNFNREIRQSGGDWFNEPIPGSVRNRTESYLRGE